jgi:phage gpG-like protein
MSFTSYDIDADKKFQSALVRAKAVTSDLTIPLTLISKDFYKSQKAIFMLKGPGQYPDLQDDPPPGRSTKREKVRLGFSVYPILKRTGRLEGSTTIPTHPDAVNQIINRRTLIIGSKVPYGVYHQSDKPRKTKLPMRKFLFIGPESTFATSDQQGRVGRWLNILNSYILKKLGGPL